MEARPLTFANLGQRRVAMATEVEAEVWRVEIGSERGEAAWFDMHVLVEAGTELGLAQDGSSDR
jgi:hypothetical protein